MLEKMPKEEILKYLLSAAHFDELIIKDANLWCNVSVWARYYWHYAAWSCLHQVVSAEWDSCHCERNMNGHWPLWSTLSLSPFQSKYDSHFDPNPICQHKYSPLSPLLIWDVFRGVLDMFWAFLLIKLTRQSVVENFRHLMKGDLNAPAKKRIRGEMCWKKVKKWGQGVKMGGAL